MSIKISILMGLLLLSPCTVKANNYFADVYGEVDEFLQLSERYDNAKDDSFLPSILTDTKEEVTHDMNDFLDDVLLMLSNDEVVKLKKSIVKLTQENQEIAEEIAELSMSKQGAETEKKFFEVWKKSQNDIESKITRLRNKSKQNTLDIEKNRQKIIVFLQTNGIELSQEEADSLLKTVTGNDFVDTIAVLKSVHAIIANLQKTLKDQDENIQIARKYYGLFWLSTKAYSRQLEIFIERIENKYLPKLEEIKAENETLIQETRVLAAKNPQYQSNLDAQKLTSEAIRLYQKALRQQKDKVSQQKVQVAQILAHAENTYKTVNLAHSLYQSMDESLSSYNALMSLPMIEMTPFKNSNLELKMLELTEQIAQ